jgi:hypothetical protein
MSRAEEVLQGILQSLVGDRAGELKIISDYGAECRAQGVREGYRAGIGAAITASADYPEEDWDTIASRLLSSAPPEPDKLAGDPWEQEMCEGADIKKREDGYGP